MTQRQFELKRNVEILVNELWADDDFRDAFVRRPRTTLRKAGDWGVALTDSELCALVAAEEFVLAEVSADLGVVAMG